MVTISASAFEHSDFLKIVEKKHILQAENIGIEYFYDTMPFYTADYYRRTLSGTRSSMHCPMKEINLLAPADSISYQYTLEKMKQALVLAHDLACTKFVLHTHVTASPITQNKADLRKLALERIAEIAEFAKKYYITILVENVGAPYKNTVLFSQDEFLDIFKKLPQVECLLDVGHARLNNWDIQEVILSLKKKLQALHLHDNFGNKDLHLPVFTGTIDFKALITAVKKTNPEAELVIEYLPPSCDDFMRMVNDGKELKKLLV